VFVLSPLSAFFLSSVPGFFLGSKVLRNDSASHCVLDHELAVLKAMMTFVRREEQVLGGVMGFGNSNVSSTCADSGAFLHDV